MLGFLLEIRQGTICIVIFLGGSDEPAVYPAALVESLGVDPCIACVLSLVEVILDYMKEGLSMGLVEIASNNSVWRGMDYYEDKKVIAWEKTGEHTYDGSVSGNEGHTYKVHIDKEHPRKSTCTCPFADGDVLYANI